MWLDLTPTATFARRNCFWCPGVSFTSPDPDGMHYGATIHQQTGKRSGNRIYDGQYAVEFTGPVMGAMGYGFVFEKLNPEPPKPNERVGPYSVAVGPNLFDCDCTAASCRVPVCRHRSMACRAIAAGLVDGAKPWAGMPEGEETPMELTEAAA